MHLMIGLPHSTASDPDLTPNVFYVLRPHPTAAQLILDVPIIAPVTFQQSSHARTCARDLGCGSGLRDFTASPTEIEPAQELRVRMARLHGRASRPDGLTAAMLSNAIALVHRAD